MGSCFLQENLINWNKNSFFQDLNSEVPIVFPLIITIMLSVPP